MGAGEGCWPGLQMERERQAVSLGPGFLHGSQVPGQLPRLCPDRYLLGPDKAKFSDQALSHDNVSPAVTPGMAGAPLPATAGKSLEPFLGRSLSHS